MYLIEYYEGDTCILQRYDSREVLLEAIKSYKNKGIKFKVLCTLDLTDLFI